MDRSSYLLALPHVGYSQDPSLISPSPVCWYAQFPRYIHTHPPSLSLLSLSLCAFCLTWVFHRSAKYLECDHNFPLFDHRCNGVCSLSSGKLFQYQVCVNQISWFYSGIWVIFLREDFILYLPIACSFRGEVFGWSVFYAGIACVAFGSAYYHLKPDNERLIWDTLPVRVTFPLYYNFEYCTGWLFLILSSCIADDDCIFLSFVLFSCWESGDESWIHLFDCSCIVGLSQYYLCKVSL